MIAIKLACEESKSLAAWPKVILLNNTLCSVLHVLLVFT